jgi:hypothetical protein
VRALEQSDQLSRHLVLYEHFVLAGHPNSAPLNLLQQSVVIAILNMGTCGAGAESAKFTFRFRNDAPQQTVQKCVTFIETTFVTTIREGLVYRDDGRSKFL